MLVRPALLIIATVMDNRFGNVGTSGANGARLYGSVGAPGVDISRRITFIVAH